MTRLQDPDQEYLDDVLSEFDVANANRIRRKRLPPKADADRPRKWEQLKPAERDAEERTRRSCRDWWE